VITGSSAGALTGLMFVVIALGADTGRGQPEEAARAFGSPIVAHFCAVLLLAAVLSMPGHSAASVALCVGAVGLAGMALSVRVIVQARRQTSYRPVLSDWIWHVALPFLAYAAAGAAALLVPHRPAPALDAIGAAALLLLFIGIHNAWDSAVWMAARRG
jgi:hypothetical protein